jgi:hypothetical protein
MSIDEAGDLRQRLNRDFEAITPRSAPVESAIRQGKTIRMRRRVTAVLSVAVVAAAGVAVPLLLHWRATQAPVTHHVVPPASAGLIGSGTVDGKHWQVRAADSGGDCFALTSGQSPGEQYCELPVAATESAPVGFTASTTVPSTTAPELLYGAVYRDVAYVTVRLADGTVLTLHPVTVYGTRYVAFAVPPHVAVDSATAYSLGGEIATAIPFNTPAGSVMFTAWLRPGQHGPTRSARVLGSGTINGRAWSVTVHAGPWGGCMALGGIALIDVNTPIVCINPLSSPGTSVSLAGWPPGSPVAFGAASASVDYVVITVHGGKTFRARAVAAGNQKFFAIALGMNVNAFRWTAYDAAGHVVASGREP